MDSLEDLMSYQRDLNQEEEYLTKLILQIDEQINRLQVEQMELQSSMFDGGCVSTKETKSSETHEDRTNEELDLSVPVNIKSVIEQDTEDEEEEEEEERLKKSQPNY